MDFYDSYDMPADSDVTWTGDNSTGWEAYDWTHDGSIIDGGAAGVDSGGIDTWMSGVLDGTDPGNEFDTGSGEVQW